MLRGPRLGGCIRRGWTWRFWGAPIFRPEVPKTLETILGPLNSKSGRPKNAKSNHDRSNPPFSALWGAARKLSKNVESCRWTPFAIFDFPVRKLLKSVNNSFESFVSVARTAISRTVSNTTLADATLVLWTLNSILFQWWAHPRRTNCTLTKAASIAAQRQKKPKAFLDLFFRRCPPILNIFSKFSGSALKRQLQKWHLTLSEYLREKRGFYFCLKPRYEYFETVLVSSCLDNCTRVQTLRERFRGILNAIVSSWNALQPEMFAKLIPKTLAFVTEMRSPKKIIPK